jgi:protein-L-isoaspartate(D-aspartate) O-methyltransferase
MAGGSDDMAMSDGQDEASRRHRALVDLLKGRGCLTDRHVEAAFRVVPRHLFLPDVPLEVVYADEAIPTKRHDGLVISSSSQPAVMAIMLDQLGLQPGDRVLEIGAGTGYNAALLAHIVGNAGQVVTMDIDDDIVAAARRHVTAAGFPAVRVVRGDGALGHAPAAPYDRIILTVGAWDIALAWIAQLRPGGRLLLPLAVQGPIQKLVAFERVDDHLASVSVRDGGFMPLRGGHAGPRVEAVLGPDTGLILGLGQSRAVAAEAVYRALTGPHTDTLAPVRATADMLWTGVTLWLAMHEPAMCTLAAVGDVTGRDRVPAVFGSGALYRSTLGLLMGTTLGLLARPADPSAPPDAVAVRRFGPDAGVVQRLIDHLQTWEVAGRPSTAGLRIRAYPRDVAYTPATGEVIIAKRDTQLVLDWP